MQSGQKGGFGRAFESFPQFERFSDIARARHSRAMTQEEKHNTIVNVTLVRCIFVVEDAVVPSRKDWFPTLTFVFAT